MHTRAHMSTWIIRIQSNRIWYYRNHIRLIRYITRCNYMHSCERFSAFLYLFFHTAEAEAKDGGISYKSSIQTWLLLNPVNLPCLSKVISGKWKVEHSRIKKKSENELPNILVNRKLIALQWCICFCSRETHAWHTASEMLIVRIFGIFCQIQYANVHILSTELHTLHNGTFVTPVKIAKANEMKSQSTHFIYRWRYSRFAFFC